MSAIIELLGIRATVNNGVWTCEDPDTLALLNSRKETIGDSPEIPDLDEELALDATTYGANILQHSDKPPPDYPEGMVH